MVGKHLDYAQFPQQFAEQVNAFSAGFLNSHVNFHRHCFFPETIKDATRKARKRYRYEDITTPYENLKSLPNVRQHLNPGMTVENLNAIALRINDHEAALALSEAHYSSPSLRQAGNRHEPGRLGKNNGALDQPDRVRTEGRDSDSPTVAQTHFLTGKDRRPRAVTQPKQWGIVNVAHKYRAIYIHP